MGARRCLKKKIYCELPETAWLCVREGSTLFTSSEELRGPRLGAWSGRTPGAEESTGVRSRDLDSVFSCLAHQPCGIGPVTAPELSVSIWEMGGGVLQEFTILDPGL